MTDGDSSNADTPQIDDESVRMDTLSIESFEQLGEQMGKKDLTAKRIVVGGEWELTAEDGKIEVSFTDAE